MAEYLEGRKLGPRVTPLNKAQLLIYTGLCNEQEINHYCGVRPLRLWVIVAEVSYAE